MAVLNKKKIGLVAAVIGLPALGYIAALHNPYTETHKKLAKDLIYPSSELPEYSEPVQQAPEPGATPKQISPHNMKAQAEPQVTDWPSNEGRDSDVVDPRNASYFVYGEYEVFANDPYLISGASKVIHSPGYSDWSRSLESHFGTYLEKEFQVRDLTSECNESVCIFQGHIDVSKTKQLSDSLFNKLHTENGWWTEWGTQFDVLPIEEGSEEGVFFIVKNKV